MARGEGRGGVEEGVGLVGYIWVGVVSISSAWAIQAARRTNGEGFYWGL
jgi:hypothetical protein